MVFYKCVLAYTVICLISLTSDFASGICNELTQCSIHQLGSSEYQLMITNGSSNSITLRVDLDFSAGVNLSFSGYLIQGVCDKAENVDPLMFEKNSSCDVEVDPEGNQIILQNCTNELVDTGGFEIIIRNCTDCVEVYIVDSIDCAARCKTEEITSSDVDGLVVKTPEKIDSLWELCPVSNLAEVQAVPSTECQRLECITFFEVACSCCSRSCPQHIYYNVNSSMLCPTELVTNCTSRLSEQDYCQASCNSVCLDCEGNDSQYCQRICEDPFQSTFAADAMTNFCQDEIETLEVEAFCATRMNCSNVTVLDTDCEDSPERCDSVCRQEGVLGFFGKGCPTDVFMFCDRYVMNLLNTSNTLTEEIFKSYIEVVESFLESVSPSLVVNSLQALFQSFENTDLLFNSSNVELLLGVFEDLFDDTVSSNWRNSTTLQDAEATFTTLYQLEKLEEMVSADFLEGDRNTSFTYRGDNLVFVVTPTSKVEEAGDQHQVSIEDSLGNFLVEIAISSSVLCKEHQNESCLSVIAVTVANNLADYIHEASMLIRNEAFTLGIPATNILTELVSVQVFGVEDLANKLVNDPIEVTLNLPIIEQTGGVILFTQASCVFWNQTERQWSDQGIETIQMANNTVKCISTHLTSFAVLVTIYHLPELPPIPVEILALVYSDQVSVGISAAALLATVCCLLFFLGRDAFRKVHFFIHLNLAFVFFLYDLMYLAGQNTAVNNLHACRFVAVWLHYFSLSTFFWMLCEGIMLYLMLVVVFSELSKKWWFFMIIGYGLPVIPVVVTLSARTTDYGRLGLYCWLAPEPNGTLYAFIAPALAIVLVNFIILVIVLVKVSRTQYERLQRTRKAKQGKKMSETSLQIHRTSTLFWKTFLATAVLTPLLGVSWILIIFVNFFHDTTAFLWMTIIFNSLQGVFIFFFHVVRSEQLWKTPRAKAIKAFFTKAFQKKKKSENSSTASEQTKSSASDTNSKNILSSSELVLISESDAALVIEITTSLSNEPNDHSGHNKEQEFEEMNP